MSNPNEPTQSGALPSVPLQPVVQPPRFIMTCPFCGKMPQFTGLFGSEDVGVWECSNPACYQNARSIGYEKSLAQWNDRYDSLTNLDKRVSARLNTSLQGTGHLVDRTLQGVVLHPDSENQSERK